MDCLHKRIVCLICVVAVTGIEFPGSCKPGQYYEPGAMECQPCPANASMITSADGFGCSCEELSIPAAGRCRPCGAAAAVTADGRSCVPRKCQSTGGKTVCRKCPGDHIAVTQNLDGSPTKELICVRCARGFRPESGRCVRCEACACTAGTAAVRGRCVPKRFLNDRPKHEETRLHPFTVLDIVKNEYFCTQNDVRACRTLASECVRNFYSPDLAGPCRFWVQPKITPPKGLPQLIPQSTSSDKIAGEFTLAHGIDTLTLVVAVHTSTGGLRMLKDPNRNTMPCMLPVQVTIGKDISADCHLNVTELEMTLLEDTFAPYLYINGDWDPVPVLIRKPNGYLVPRDGWPSNKFNRYFLIDNSPSIVSNVTNVVYLKNLVIQLKIQRDKYKSSSLRLRISLEAQYATKSPLSQVVTTSLTVENELPNAGVLRGLEVWGGVLGALWSLYAVVQWRGATRRGAIQATFLPLVAGTTADALYFAAWLSSIHALAAEAGTLGLTLPLSHSEDNLIKVFVYSAVTLKLIKVAWMNWKQCTCDIFFLDWSEYNPPIKEGMETVVDKADSWRAKALAREWNLLQAKRRACPGYTVTLVLLMLELTPWRVLQSKAYKWAAVTSAWLVSYVAVLAARWTWDRVVGPPTSELPKVCAGVGLSLLVFQEEYYAHYVHGRNDDGDGRSMSGPLSTCRVVCAPQLRIVYKQLSTSGLVSLGETDTKHALLSRFLAAFFERALDGLSWVGSERSLAERLLDVELVARENSATSALLYDPDGGTASCFALTWWGEEWTLGTFDAMLFGAVYVASENSQLSALVIVILWQIMKSLRLSFGIKNMREKTYFFD